MIIEQAKVVSIKGRTKTIAGSALLLTGEIEDRGMVEMLVFRHEWPCGVIDPFVIGEIVDVCVDSYGDYLVARLLPFENQGSKTTCKLLTKLVQRADKQGNDALTNLPITRWGEQHLTPHPMASELNRLLEQVPDVDNEEEAF